MDWLPGDFNRGDVLLLGSWGTGWIVFFALSALAVLGLTWLDLHELRAPRRWLLVGLRAAVLTITIALLLEPALELKHVTVVRNHIALLFDTSRSQDLPNADGERRIERLQEAATELQTLAERPSDQHLFDVWAFDSSLRSTDFPAVLDTSLHPVGDQTRILEALEALVQQTGTRDLGGVVIVSDGVDNGALGVRNLRGQPLDAESSAWLAGLGVPVHTIATSQAQELRDVAIQKVYHDDFAFVRNATRVEVELKVLGYPEEALTVTLKREGVPVQTRDVRVAAGETTARVEFEFVPELLGKEIYSVEVPVRSDEAIASNNVEHFVVSVIRDKIRALLVVGRPGWDVRFMRQLLKGNPNVDLISFFILRTDDDLQRTTNDQMSLIPFPTDELFNEQLGSFDLVVFQNFNFGPYQMRQYLPKVRDYVRQGGGFVMVGGDLSFGSGGYANTEIAEILPVELPGTSNPASLIDTGSFRPVLTEAGRRHPITRLEFDAVGNAQLWERLPELRGTNIVGPARDGATVLAAHPSLTAGGAALPVITVSEMGKGRSMAVTVDTTWRWSFDGVAQRSTSGAYGSFWNSAIRWLIRDPELNLVRLEIPEDVYAPGESVDATVRVLTADYGPAIGAQGTLELIRRDLSDLADGPREVVATMPFVADAQGRVPFAHAVVEEGAYSLRATVPVADGEELSDEEIFLAVSASREHRDIEPRPELLQAISEATGGRHFEEPSDFEEPEFRPARVEQVNRRRVIQFWSSPWLFLTVLALAAVEWTLRRRWGRA